MNKNIKNISLIFVFGVVATLVLFGTAYSDSNEVHRKTVSNPAAVHIFFWGHHVFRRFGDPLGYGQSQQSVY